MIHYYDTSDNAKDADEQLPAPRRNVHEDTGNLEDSTCQQVEAKDLDQDEQLATQCYQYEQTDEGGDNPLQENQLPGEDGFFRSRIRRCFTSHLRLRC